MPYLGAAPIQTLNTPMIQGLIALWPRIKEEPSVCWVCSVHTSASVPVHPVVLGKSASHWLAELSLWEATAGNPGSCAQGLGAKLCSLREGNRLLRIILGLLSGFEIPGN